MPSSCLAPASSGFTEFAKGNVCLDISTRKQFGAEQQLQQLDDLDREEEEEEEEFLAQQRHNSDSVEPPAQQTGGTLLLLAEAVERIQSSHTSRSMLSLNSAENRKLQREEDQKNAKQRALQEEAQPQEIICGVVTGVDKGSANPDTPSTMRARSVSGATSGEAGDESPRPERAVSCMVDRSSRYGGGSDRCRSRRQHSAVGVVVERRVRTLSNDHDEEEEEEEEEDEEEEGGEGQVVGVEQGRQRCRSMAAAIPSAFVSNKNKAAIALASATKGFLDSLGATDGYGWYSSGDTYETEDETDEEELFGFFEDDRDEEDYSAMETIVNMLEQCRTLEHNLDLSPGYKVTGTAINTTSTVYTKSYEDGTVVALSVGGFRVVSHAEKRKQQHAEYLFLLCVDNGDGETVDSYRAWRRFSQVKCFARQFAGRSDFATSQESWASLEKQHGWFRCLEQPYLWRQTYFLNAYLKDLLGDLEKHESVARFLGGKRET